MMQAGKLGRAELQLMIEQLGKMAAGSVAGQLGSIGAQMTLLANSFTAAKLAFGSGFFPVVSQGIAQLNAAFQDDSALAFFNSLGILAGIAANAVMTAVTMIGQVMAGAVSVFRLVYNAVTAAWAAIQNSPFGGVLADMGALLPAFMSFNDILFGIGTLIGIAAAAWVGYRTAVGLAAAAQLLLTAATAPWALAVVAAVAGIAYLTGGLGKLQKALVEMTSGFTTSIQNFGKMDGSAKNAAQSLVSTKNGADNAAAGVNGAGNESGKATGKIDSLGSSASSTASDFNRMATAARNAADAIRDLAKAKSRASSAGDGSDSSSSTSADTLRQGGVANRVTNPTTRISPTAFANAPHFASGGTTTGMPKILPDGGIPSILHPNEAVIPLAGGAVPVQLMGLPTAQSDPGMTVHYKGPQQQENNNSTANAILKLMTPLISINRYAGAIREKAVDIQSSIRNESDRHFALETQTNNLLTIVTTKFDVMMKSLSEMSTSMSAMASSVDAMSNSISSLSVTGSSTVDMSTSDATAMTPEELADQKKKGVGLFGSSGGYYIDESGVIRFGIPGVTGPPKSKLFPGAGGMMFDTGSPNVFKEATGRSANVTIHPNEAVVPLPDGRRIPVEFGDGMGPVSRTSTWTPISGGGSGWNKDGGITVNMTVFAKDASSFRASEDQIYQQMSQKLRRAVRNLGQTDEVDDPTRRIE
jgi:hypothetical protein